jgi:hypothetical protein
MTMRWVARSCAADRQRHRRASRAGQPHPDGSQLASRLTTEVAELILPMTERLRQAERERLRVLLTKMQA